MGVGNRALGVQALWRAESIEVQATLDLKALDGGVLDVVALERQLAVARGDGVFVDEIAVLVIEHRHIEVA